MKVSGYFLTFLLAYMLPVGFTICIACSVCKVTINGNTYLGNNEDSWRIGSRIWFENRPGKLGCVYVGYNEHPQGGMNEAGLAFDGLTTLPKPIRNQPLKKEINNPTDFLKEIMQTCNSIAEVKRFAIQYNRQKLFNHGEYLFADRAGNYLVMESDTMITGNDDKYLIANFCPSITSEEEKLKNWDRYKRGKTFLNNHRNDTSSNFCFALTDTMHECRKRIGDGTMYSFVADLTRGNLTLCFYHDFQHPITFNLQQELAKGDHAMQMAAIFPGNAEYMKFLDYKMPRNNMAMLLFVFLGGGLFAFSALFFSCSFLWQKSKVVYNRPGGKSKILVAVLSAILLYYMTVLYNEEGIYYAPAPYKDFKFSILNVAAYIPFLLLVVILPLVQMNVQVFRNASWDFFSKGLLTINNLFYFAFIALFFYWGFYSIF